RGCLEDTIPAGEYGGGTVQLWDRGYWQPEGSETPQQSLANGDLRFTLEGERLRELGAGTNEACANRAQTCQLVAYQAKGRTFARCRRVRRARRRPIHCVRSYDGSYCGWQRARPQAIHPRRKGRCGSGRGLGQWNGRCSSQAGCYKVGRRKQPGAPKGSVGKILVEACRLYSSAALREHGAASQWP